MLCHPIRGAISALTLGLCVVSAPVALNPQTPSQTQPQHQQNNPKDQNPQPSWASYPVRPESEALDFGEIATTTTARAKLRVTNFGKKTHELIRAQGGKSPVSCNLRSGTKLAPGESIELEFQMSGPARAGVIQNKHYRLLCAGQPDIVLPIRARAISFVEVEPNSIDLDGEVDPEICLRSIDDQPFRVSASTPDCMHFMSRKQSNVHLLTLNIEALRNAGFKRQIILKMDHPQCKSVMLRVKRKAFDDAKAKHSQRGTN
jgi:hypothetical protein